MKGEPGVSLVPLDNSNRDAVRAILVTSHHERRFVRQTAETLEWGAEKLERAAAAELEPMFWLVYSGSTTVGFVTIFDDVEPPSIEHSLWGLLIDERYRRRGFGTATLDLIADRFRRRGVEVMWTKAVDQEGSLIPFYERYGFERTGHVLENEVLLRFDLTPGASPNALPRRLLEELGG